MSRVSYSVKVNGEKQRITVNTNTGDEHLHETSPVPKKAWSNTQKEKLKEYGLNFSAVVILIYVAWCVVVILLENITIPMAISLIPLIIGIIAGIVYAIYHKIQTARFNWKVMGILSKDEYDEYEHILWKIKFFDYDYKGFIIQQLNQHELDVYTKVVAHFGKFTYNW